MLCITFSYNKKKINSFVIYVLHANDVCSVPVHLVLLYNIQSILK